MCTPVKVSLLGEHGNSCPDTGVNIFSRPHGLSILRVEEGEFGGEFEGNSREFDGGFGEFDAFQYVRGAMNPSTGARWGRGKVCLYKIKRGNAVEGGSGLAFHIGKVQFWFLPRRSASDPHPRRKPNTLPDRL